MKKRTVNVCVLYDPKSGKIAHIHQTITFEGARASTKEEIEAQARGYVSKQVAGREHLKAAHLGDVRFKRGNRYSIDANSGQLVDGGPLQAR